MKKILLKNNISTRVLNHDFAIISHRSSTTIRHIFKAIFMLIKYLKNMVETLRESANIKYFRRNDDISGHGFVHVL